MSNQGAFGEAGKQFSGGGEIVLITTKNPKDPGSATLFVTRQAKFDKELTIALTRFLADQHPPGFTVRVSYPTDNKGVQMNIAPAENSEVGYDPSRINGLKNQLLETAIKASAQTVGWTRHTEVDDWTFDMHLSSALPPPSYKLPPENTNEPG